MTKWTLLGVGALVGACASVGAPTPIVPEPTVIRSYEIGQVRSAGIGEAIFDVQAARAVPVYVVLRDHDPGIDRWNRFERLPGLREGQTLRAVAELPGDIAVVDVNGWQLAISPNAQVLGYVRSGNYSGEWPADPLVRRVTSLEGLPEAFRAQVIYSGVDGETVRAVYREYTGDFIRPAFSQELQYNLARDSIIAYRSVRIRVLDANNTAIRYQVVDDGGLDWIPMR